MSKKFEYSSQDVYYYSSVPDFEVTEICKDGWEAYAITTAKDYEGETIHTVYIKREVTNE